MTYVIITIGLFLELTVVIVVTRYWRKDKNKRAELAYLNLRKRR